MRRIRIWLLLILSMVSLTSFGRHAVQLTIDGGIGPATAEYIENGIQSAQADADLVIIVLNTPGGLDSSTRLIVQSVLASRIPVVTYVAPNGARAASAGTFLIYASTIAAMAPSTHLGAASPVSLTGNLGQNKKKGEDKPSTMEKKVTNDAVAYIRSLAQLRDRNVEFAELAIKEAATLTSTEALKKGVIEYIAPDVDNLLTQLDGKTVHQSGQKITLDTKNISIKSFEPNWRMKFLLIITDPTVAYLLLLLGVYGIFFELFNPGFIVPGVIGGVAMIIALYALQMLPVSFAGLGLILLGIAFIIAEIFNPSFGALGIGGTAAFIIGSIMLMDTEVEAFQIAWSAILGMAAANILLFGIFLGMAVRSRKRKALNSTTHLMDEVGRVITPLEPEGQIMVHGEIWSAYSDTPVNKGEHVRVTGISGLRLTVKPVNE